MNDSSVVRIGGYDQADAEQEERRAEEAGSSRAIQARRRIGAAVDAATGAPPTTTRKAATPSSSWTELGLSAAKSISPSEGCSSDASGLKAAVRPAPCRAHGSRTIG